MKEITKKIGLEGGGEGVAKRERGDRENEPGI